MPYVRNEQRDVALMPRPMSAGTLNYVITKICDEYAGRFASYDMLNTVIGVLESAKLEFYRRVVAQYEEAKLKENGDVYMERTTK